MSAPKTNFADGKRSPHYLSFHKRQQRFPSSKSPKIPKKDAQNRNSTQTLISQNRESICFMLSPRAGTTARRLPPVFSAVDNATVVSATPVRPLSSFINSSCIGLPHQRPGFPTAPLTSPAASPASPPVYPHPPLKRMQIYELKSTSALVVSARFNVTYLRDVR